MAITLANPARQFALWAAVSLAAFQIAFSARDFLATHFATKTTADALILASRLDPGNADYHYRLGRFFAFEENDTAAALPHYQSAVRLNPHNARYWLDLAGVYQVMGDISSQRTALQNAIRANPNNPDVAWEAGNFFLVQGDSDLAFRQFRTVLANQPNQARLALQLCWRVSPDVDNLLATVVPPTTDAHIAFLSLLLSKKDVSSAAKVWQHLVDLHQPFDNRHLFDYIKFLIANREVDQARLAWQQGATLLKLNSYLPGDNLIVNGDFSEEVLNGGFDWTYQAQPGVTLTLDPTQFQSGHQSLSIAFDGDGIKDAGIFHLIAVKPVTTYGFSAFYRSSDMQGAGGPVLTVRDFYSGQSYFASEELKDSDVWKRLGAEFTTALDTQLLVVRIERIPPGNIIRGRLWIDNFNLAPK